LFGEKVCANKWGVVSLEFEKGVLKRVEFVDVQRR
jgi:hypothetical protein